MNKRQYKKKCKRDLIKFITKCKKSFYLSSKSITNKRIEDYLITQTQKMFQEIANSSFGKSKVSVDKMNNNSLKLNVNIKPEKPIKLYSIEIDCDKLNEEALIDL